MKTDYRHANRIKEEWLEQTPMLPRDKIFIALIAVLVLVPVIHGLLSYGSLPISDKRGDLLWGMLLDVILGVAAVAELIFPRFFSKKLFQRFGNDIVDGARLFCGIFGSTLTLFFAYLIESNLLASISYNVRVNIGFCAVVVLELAVYLVWLLRRWLNEREWRRD